MAVSWRNARLSSLIKFTRDGEWGSDQPAEGRVEMLVIRGTDFARLRHGELGKIPRRYIERRAAERKQLQVDDVLIETAGGTKDQSTGRTAFVKRSHIERAGIPLTCASFARFLRFNREKVEPAFMYWWLQNQHVLGEMEKHQVQHTGVARFQFTKFIETVDAALPSISEQRAIAHILGVLDDKIEMSRRMSETLAATAQAIFKSWFVDFDPVYSKISNKKAIGVDAKTAALFPDSLEDSELGDIPKGWNISKLGDVAKAVLGGTPSRTEPSYWGGSIPWINSGKANEFRVIEPSEFITQDGLNSSATKMLPSRTTIIAITGATLGQVSLTEIEVCANQSIVGVIGTDTLPSEYIYLWVRENIQNLIASQTGGAQQHINKNNVNDLLVLCPNEPVISAYIRFVRPIFDRIKICCFESRDLAALRNTLLPKLMSGELQVRNIKYIAEAATK